LLSRITAVFSQISSKQGITWKLHKFHKMIEQKWQVQIAIFNKKQETTGENRDVLYTPWILFPVTGHLGPLALFLVLWYTSFPPIPKTSNTRTQNQNPKPIPSHIHWIYKTQKKKLNQHEKERWRMYQEFWRYGAGWIWWRSCDACDMWDVEPSLRTSNLSLLLLGLWAMAEARGLRHRIKLKDFVKY
jgi:hypothetical protein